MRKRLGGHGLIRYLERPVVGTPGTNNLALLNCAPRPIQSVVGQGRVAGGFPVIQPTLLYGYTPYPYATAGEPYSPVVARPLADAENRFQG